MLTVNQRVPLGSRGRLVRDQQAEPFFPTKIRELVTDWVHWLGVARATGRILVGLDVVEILPEVGVSRVEQEKIDRP